MTLSEITEAGIDPAMALLPFAVIRVLTSWILSGVGPNVDCVRKRAISLSSAGLFVTPLAARFGNSVLP